MTKESNNQIMRRLVMRRVTITVYKGQLKRDTFWLQRKFRDSLDIFWDIFWDTSIGSYWLKMNSAKI